MRKLIGIAIGLMLAAGCHAQIPPASTKSAVLTWSAPQAVTGGWQGCTTANPCVYAVYRAITTGSTCPATGSAQWSELTTASTRPSALTYTDTTAAGLNVCYAVETVQASLNSGPSNTVNLTVPGVPGAPQLGTPTIALNAIPQMRDVEHGCAPGGTCTYALLHMPAMRLEVHVQ